MRAHAKVSDPPILSRDGLYRELVEGVMDYAILLLDLDGRIQTWSSGAERINGYSGSEIIGQRIDMLYPPESRAEHLPDLLLQQAATLGHVEHQGWRVRKDGSWFWADVVINAVKDPQGKLVGFAKVTRDLTQRRVAREQRWDPREALVHSEERFRLLVESVEEYAIFMLDPHGIVATWNSGAERIKGYRADEIIGKHVSVFRTESEARAGASERALEQAARDGKVEEEGWRIRKDGSRFFASVVLSAIRDSTGQLLGFAEITRDLTQRQLLDEERLQRARAEEAVRLRDEFLLIASHELKTPLTSIQLDIYAMRHDHDGDRAKLERRLERAARNVERLAALIDSLLSVSRLSQGKLILKPATMDLAQAVAQVVDNMRGQASRAGCQVVLEHAESVAGIWDRLRIEQVVMNLLANAFKYGAGAPVTVAVAREGDQAVVEVRDHGPGVAEADRERIFERFERASSARHFGGLGLGLYVSREIVKAHAGTISAANHPDGGAVLTVRLPVTGRHESGDGFSAG